MSKLIAIIASVVLAGPSAVAADRDTERLLDVMKRPLAERGLLWLCTVKVTHSCTKDRCVTRREPKDFFAIDFAVGIYRFCSDEGVGEKKCTDWTKVHVTHSGIYTVLREEGKLGFLNILNDGSEFLSTATLFGNHFVRFGVCEKR